MMKTDTNNKHLTHRKVKNANKTKKGIKLVKHFVIVKDYFWKWIRYLENKNYWENRGYNNGIYGEVYLKI